MAYIFDSTWSYSDYLQARDFLNQGKTAVREAADRGARTVSMAISGETRRLIASQETLAREGFQLQRETAQAQLEAQREMNTTLKEGFECLSYELAEISDGISELNATFHWGFSQMIAQMGRMNDTLDQLHAIAKTPVQTVAFNHFEIARDAYRQGLYAETIEELDKAIGGDHTSPGYKLEWRFHHLRGVVRLGSFESGPAPVNLPEAEESFLAAARYAQKDYQPEAARALLSAGWAAYCQGKIPEALAHTEQAMQLDPGLNEALFQASKLHMAMDQPQRALPLLGKLVKAQTFYAIKAAGDGDFQRYESELRQYLEALRQEKLRQLAPQALALLKLVAGGRGPARPELYALAREIARPGSNVPLMDLEEFAREVESQDFLRVLESVLLAETQRQDKLRQIVSKAEEFLNLANEGKLLAHPRLLALARDIVRPDSPTPMIELEEFALTVNWYPSLHKEEEHFTVRITVSLGGMFKRAVYREEPRTVERFFVAPHAGLPMFAMDFVRIPAGEFVMGEGKQSHKVRITRDFLLGRYPVTWDQYQVIMGHTSEVSFGECPYNQSAWSSVQIWIARLNKCAGKSLFRLPTEAEWEYACRAGCTGTYCFGDNAALLGEYAWYDQNSGKQFHPVGQKKPNAWGLHDMHGNVEELCQDGYAENYAQGSQTDPQIAIDGNKYRVQRGGCFISQAKDCRSVSRRRQPYDVRQLYCGFRLARTI